MDFYRHLLADYREQVYEFFNGLVLREAAHSNKRSEYQRVCSHLRLLIKIGGGSIAADLVKHLMFEYCAGRLFAKNCRK
ncbi:MAG TPA: hypothetical protein VN379_09185 [Sporomusa sp.]|nr:hypothetical protein [Sporomusa sp.]